MTAKSRKVGKILASIDGTRYQRSDAFDINAVMLSHLGLRWLWR